MSLFTLVAQFIRRQWRAYGTSALLLAVIALLTVWLPRQVGQVVDALVARRLDSAGLAHELGLIVLAGVAIYFMRVTWRQLLYAAAYGLGVELRTRLYERLSLQGPRFYQTRRTGDLMALATNDIDAVEQAAGEAVLAGFDGTQTLLLVVASMALGVDWRLTLVALLPFPVMAWSFWWISNHVHTASRESLDHFGHLNDQVHETLSGVRTVRALGLEARSTADFAVLADRAAQASLKAQRWEAAYEPAVGFTLSTAMVLSLGMGGYLVWHDQLSIGQLTSFSLYLGQMIWPMFAAGWVLSLIERGRAAWDRLQPVLNEPLSVLDDGAVTQIQPGDLQAHELVFAYPGQSRPALAGVSWQIQPGQTLGLVGPTGAGKSTLVRLLLRQFAPASGGLQWGGVALSDYRLDTLRAAVSWVPQEPFLFSASVAENIALARPDATRAQIEHVAHMAAVHDDILRLPKGYDTPVGERGVTLSGGQRQRIAIARALLADAPLLLLDDALSAVDTDTEARILRHLHELRAQRPERIVIVVSHRLSAVADADHVLVLRDGQLSEQGHHAHLLALQGWYARQWRYQQLEQQLESDDAAA
ncbi:MAG: ATP-binding cassette domain-containing protein [Burkholderiales bacterium]|nr:ATP-binding cassette domain-containing protein [Burkholderiales bacterium]